VDAAAARRDFLRFHGAILAHHFEEEERALAGFIRDGMQRERLLREHRSVQDGAARLAGADEAFQRELGERLRAHVRFEEDELFPVLQRDLSEVEWAQVADAAKAYRRQVRPNSVGAGSAEECYL
jgi:hemerythrin-like domain-containing protein